MSYPEKGYYLDRKLTRDQCTAIVHAAGTTTWTLPYALPTDGSEGVLVVTDAFSGEEYATTRPATNQVAVTGEGDLSGSEVNIGVLYRTRQVLSTVYPRDANGVADTGGRVQLRQLLLEHTETTDFTVTVEPDGRAEKTYTFDADALSAGSFRVPVLAKNDQVEIEIVNETPGPCAFAGLTWEATFDRRSRRI